MNDPEDKAEAITKADAVASDWKAGELADPPQQVIGIPDAYFTGSPSL